MPLKNKTKGKTYKLINKISAWGLVSSILGQSILSVPAYADTTVGYSIYDAINLTGDAAEIPPNKYDLEDDVALGDGSEAGTLPTGVTSLGTLTRTDSTPRIFTINGNNHTLDGADNGGVVVNSGDTLTISALTVTGFNGAFVTNAGTLEFDGTNNMFASVSGTGTITNTGSLTIGAGYLDKQWNVNPYRWGVKA